VLSRAYRRSRWGLVTQFSHRFHQEYYRTAHGEIAVLGDVRGLQGVGGGILLERAVVGVSRHVVRLIILQPTAARYTEAAPKQRLVFCLNQN
jgi:hypothetical protein